MWIRLKNKQENKLTLDSQLHEFKIDRFFNKIRLTCLVWYIIKLEYAWYH